MTHKEKNHNVPRPTSKRLSIWAGVVACLLILPVVTGASWTTADFIFAAVLLFGSATVYELVTRKISNPNYRFAVGVAAVTFVLCIWAMAVAN